MSLRAGSRGQPLRRAWALLGQFQGDQIHLLNFSERTTLPCQGAALAALAEMGEWIPAAEARRRLRRAGEPRPDATLRRLRAASVLLERGSAAEARDTALRRSWRWGPVAAAFHRSLRDVAFVGLDQVPWLLRVWAHLEPPPASRLPARRERSLRLPAPRRSAGLLRHLLQRRSVRDFSRGPLSRREVAEVLFAGLGVRESFEAVVHGRLHLRLAPSGGALGPYDAYLYARRVKGLAPGVYRYDAIGGGLERIRRGAPVAPRELLGGQEWTDGAAALVFLVATFGRTSWKYRHPVAYRVVLLEAGHIAQNLLLSACSLGLAATPTCALADSRIERLLGLDGPDRAAVHAVVLGRPAQGSSRSRSAFSSAAGP